MRASPTLHLVLAALGVLLLAACGGADPTPTATATTVPTSTLCEPDIGEDVELFKRVVRPMQLGFRTTVFGIIVPVPAEALIITGDLNILDVQLVVLYQIKDVDAFVSNVADPEGCPDGRTLRDATQVALSQVVGQRSMDDTLLEKRVEVQADTQLLLQQLLDDYGTGIQVLNVVLQAVRPPDEVRDAFDDVVRARMDKESRIDEAMAYWQDQIPRAAGRAAQIIQAAEAVKAARIIQAEGEADSFVSILRAYDQEESATFKGLYLESLESILPGITEFIEAVESTASSSQT